MAGFTARGSYRIDMLNGPLLGKMTLFALPLAASTVLQQLFNAADIAVVGRFASRQALAAVGSNNATINLLIGLFVGLSIGTNVLIAKYIGQGATERVQRAVHTSIVVALASGAFLLCFGQLYSRPMLEFMKAPEDVIDMATVNGAKALGLEGCGEIKAGAKADLTVLDIDKPWLRPWIDLRSSLAYCARGDEVTDVMVDGRFLLRKGELLTIDRERVLFEVDRTCRRLGLIK